MMLLNVDTKTLLVKDHIIELIIADEGHTQNGGVKSMVKEEYKQFSCADIGMACGFQVRAKTVDEVMMHLKSHAAKVHDLKEISPDMEKKVKGAIKSVSVDVTG